MCHRQEETQKITEVVKPFDWSYTTDYKGTTSSSGPQLETSDKAIPLDLLRRPDPILLFDEIVLYEDEMADNGITMYSCKIRVMPDRLLLLCRFFMRLDNVLFRIRDTRVFVEFGTGEIIREYVAREEEYEKVRLVSCISHLLDSPLHFIDDSLGWSISRPWLTDRIEAGERPR